jgi:3-deoxy-D-manno-octulosonate 8-phosphate phosphatase (KDO 8-P phosphatase)
VGSSQNFCQTAEMTLVEKLKRTRLLVLDVDGVLTDGRVVYGGGEEFQFFDVQDGQGLAWLRKVGITVAWITGRGCEATRRRAEELGVVELHVKSGPKHLVLADVQSRLGIARDETVAMGDDWPDLAFAREAGCFVAPANARAEVRERADFVTSAFGGRGAVRELCESILSARGELESLLTNYTGETTEAP